MSYLRNTWYVAGHPHEVADKPPGRTYLDEPVLIYRTESGQLVAMDDRCPHRMAPLHMGKVVGESIQCPYHGLQFDGTGRCTLMPIGGEAPPRATLRRYPIVERHSLLWIWMGDADLADAELIPDYSDRDDPSIGWFTGSLYCKANYQLMVDNLLDLSHAEYLHPFLSSPGWGQRNRQEVSQTGDRVTILNTAEQDHILPVAKMSKPSLGDIGTTIQTERWDVPSLVRLSIDYYSGDDFLLIPSAHMLTPETKSTTHYFIRGGQTLDPANVELTQANGAALLGLFQSEDFPMLEAQQRSLGDRDFMSVLPAVLVSDKGAMLARRHLARRIREEQARVDSPVSASPALS